MTLSIETILSLMERGLADATTAKELKAKTDHLFECPACHCLVEDLYGQKQICSICYITKELNHGVGIRSPES